MSDIVSIIIPVLNEAASVERAVAAALGQTYPHVEVLVIDGRSTDNTRDLVRAIARVDPRVALLDNPAGGISTALNVGLAHARGEFVARVDGHASVNEEYLATGVAHLQADETLASVGGRRVGVAQTQTGLAIALALSSPFGVGNSINHYGGEIQETDHSSFGVYRTRVARAVNGWDENLVVNEDVDFDYRIRQHGHRILYDPTMIIKWHVRETIRDLARQYRRYGRGKGAMVTKNGPQAVRLRHLAAPALVVVLAGAGCMATSRRWRLALGLIAPYGAAVAGASAITVRRGAGHEELDSFRSRIALPASFVAMHTAWGLGFFEGLAGRRPAATSQR